MNEWLSLALLFTALAVSGYLCASVSGRAIHGYRQFMLQQTRGWVRRLFLKENVQPWVNAYLLSLIMVPIFFLLIGLSWLWAACWVAVMALSPTVIFNHLLSRRLKNVSLALPDALSQIAAAMRAGATLTIALQHFSEEDDGPLGQELSLMLREYRMGARMEDALHGFSKRLHNEDINLLVSAIVIAQEVGGNLAEILQVLSDSIRQKIEMEGKIIALTSQGKLQGYVVSSLPLMLLVALSFLEPQATLPIFTSLLGWGHLAVMAILALLGAIMIRKIITIEI